jgi:hypothetical protein
MDSPVRRRNRLALWYENMPRPHWVLAVLILLLYAPTLGGGFMLDDHRCLRVLREYHAGDRPSPSVYEFLGGGSANLREQEAGWYPWWMTEDLRYRHLRPLTEWMLYGEYRLFGDHALGFRIVGLSMYVIGVWLVLALLRLVGRDERIARWGSLIFAVGAAHAVPVVFISAQCDLLALVLALAAILLAGRFIAVGRFAALFWASLIFAAGLFSKEAVFPCAALPACMAFCFPQDRVARRRAVGATMAFAAIAAVWLAYYVSHGYGANTSLMLDPVHDTRDYLAQLPMRALLLLSSWLIPLNPFLLEFQLDARQYLVLYAAIGLTALVAVTILFIVRHRRQRGVAAMALWPLVFLPVLVCTPPDDRVMVLPGVGLAFLSAMWMTLPRDNGSFRLRLIPFWLFIVIQTLTTVGIGPLVQFMESETQRKLRHMAADGEPLLADGWIIVVNNAYPFEGLFMQDRFRHIGLTGGAMLLADTGVVRTQRIDDHTLRIEAAKGSLLTGFLGRMGTSHEMVRRIGDTSRVGPTTVRVSAAGDGKATAIDVRLDRPLDWPGYRFFETRREGMPVRCSLERATDTSR